MTIKTVFDYLSIATTIIVMVSVFMGIWSWFRGISPTVLRLGKGLANRKIAVFAKGDHLASLRDLLLDSHLFRKKNLIEVTSANDLGKAEGLSVFLVFWEDWKEEIDRILTKKLDSTALIVYAPQELGFIPQEQMQKISENRNATVTNFRGRLLNDIVISMITTGYD